MRRSNTAGNTFTFSLWWCILSTSRSSFISPALEAHLLPSVLQSLFHFPIPPLPPLQVYRGVRIAGLHMSLKRSQNQGAPHFPHDYPDCPAGVRFQEEQEAELLDKFKRSVEGRWGKKQNGEAVCDLFQWFTNPCLSIMGVWTFSDSSWDVSLLQGNKQTNQKSDVFPQYIYKNAKMGFSCYYKLIIVIII